MPAYDPGRVIDALSRSRLDRFLQHTKGDEGKALHMHDQSLQYEGGLWSRIGYVELVLRTAVAGQLERTYGSDWHVNGSALWKTMTPPGEDSLQKAVDKAGSHVSPGCPLTASDVVEYSTFDLWRFFLIPHYQATLWARGGYARTFPGFGSNDRAGIEAQVKKVYNHRNAIAHHRLTVHPRCIQADCRTVVAAVSSDAVAHFDFVFK